MIEGAPKDRSLSALASLISNATKIVEDHFLTSPEGGYVPSLDDTAEHPLDSQILPSHIRQAVQTIEAACAQLCAAVVKPQMTILNRTLEIYCPPCLNAALEFKVADALLDKPNGMHIADLAASVKVDADKLGRILRLLATRHMFREVTPDVFANNRLSMQLVSSNPISSYALTMTGEMGRLIGDIPNVLKDPEWGSSQDPCKTAFNKYTGYQGNFFEYFESDMAPPGLGDQFARAMVGLSSATESDAILHEYPWSDLPEGASVCDLGGGVGHMLMRLGQTHPHLRLKLQDIPKRINHARAVVWPQQFPQALEQKRVEFQTVDFFTQPPINGCNVYYLKHILHDWPDSKCLDILRNIRQAMTPDSRILIHDYIVQRATRDPKDKGNRPQAPVPLLPNYGIARFRQYGLDISMMGRLNGRERSLSELVDLAEAAELEFVKVWDFDELALIELRVKA
ncbi:O-methyltransferase-domain-containing protein [Coprinopsis sp. MPI-PUGE-AT-0042]|nr:O-methyltransferase-domain-containing protein [Coprinopsis sp. MPI-PUGE-AT-0042]